MAEVTKKVLVLGFTNAIGKNVSVTVNEPVANASGEVISSVMDEIISSGALGEDGVVCNKIDAKYVVQQEEKIEIQ